MGRLKIIECGLIACLIASVGCKELDQLKQEIAAQEKEEREEGFVLLPEMPAEQETAPTPPPRVEEPGPDTHADYATFNPLDKHANVMLSEDLLTVSSTTIHDLVRADIGHSTGKWYYEFQVRDTSLATSLGLMTKSSDRLEMDLGIPGNRHGCAWHPYGIIECQDGARESAPSYDPGDVIGIAVDFTSSTELARVYFSKNGEWVNQANPARNLGYVEMPRGSRGEKFYPAASVSRDSVITANFGASDFYYTAPGGFNPGWSKEEAPSAIACELADTPELVREMFMDFISDVSADFSADASDTSYSLPAHSDCAKFETHVISTSSGGYIDLTIERTNKPVVLVLMSIEPTTWNLHLLPGARLAQVISIGQWQSEVVGLPISIRHRPLQEGYCGVQGRRTSAALAPRTFKISAR